MLKWSIAILGLCCVSTQLYSAAIYVTTTEDVVADDRQCSLREAVEYVNLGMPKEGYHGCGGEGAENTIYLKSHTEYKLNRQLKIQKNVVIRTLADQSNSERPEKVNATIRMTGTDRLFWVERKAAMPESEETQPGPILVSFLQLNLKGCDAEQCQEQGGLIYNKENIEIRLSQLSGGKAKQGGAIYSAGEFKTGQALSSVTMFDSQFKANKAAQGAVLYSELPQFIGARLVVRDNESTAADASLFDVKNPFTEAQLKDLGIADYRRGITNSSFFKNKGYLLKILDGMVVNNTTMLMNDKGVIIDAPLKKGYLVNSILLHNGTQDCRVISGAEPDNISNNLYHQGCVGTAGQQLAANVTVLAGQDIEGNCDIYSQGILCPFNSKSNDSPWGFFKPRLLDSYTKMTDSPIVNRGPKSGSGLLSCAAEDQRGKPRPVTDPEYCDRGATELYVDINSTPTVGADILFGQTAKMTLDEQLKDGELVRPETCVQMFGQRPDGQPWQPGCMKVVQNNVTPNSKGSVTLSQDGQLTYVPHGNWHGLDEFTTMVVTTTARFNEASNPYVQITTRIVQAPPNTFEDKKVGGGSTSLFGLLGLVTLAGIRYGRRKLGE